MALGLRATIWPVFGGSDDLCENRETQRDRLQRFGDREAQRHCVSVPSLGQVWRLGGSVGAAISARKKGMKFSELLMNAIASGSVVRVAETM